MKISHTAKVGLVASLAFVLALAGIGILKGDFFIRGTRLVAIYDNVDGLTASAPVIIKDIKVGGVDEIGFVPGNVNKLYVRFHVKKSLDIPVGSVAAIVSTDLFGRKALEIKPALHNRFVMSGDTLTGITEEGFTFDMDAVDSVLTTVVNQALKSKAAETDEENFNK